MKKLDIDNCIIKGDVIRIQLEPPVNKIKTKWNLSKILSKKKLFKSLSHTALYTKLYRLEREGFEESKAPKELIEAVLNELNNGIPEKLTEADLIKEL